MPMSQFVDNVDRPNEFLLSKAKEQPDSVGFCAYIYKVVDTYDHMMNENWDNWVFPPEVKYSETLIELMRQVPKDKPKDWRAGWAKEIIYDVAVALGSNYESFGTLMLNTRI